MMDNVANVVTISIEEYFDLRTRADMSATLLAKFAEMEARFIDFDRRLWDVERHMRKRENGC